MVSVSFISLVTTFHGGEAPLNAVSRHLLDVPVVRLQHRVKALKREDQ